MSTVQQDKHAVTMTAPPAIASPGLLARPVRTIIHTGIILIATLALARPLGRLPLGAALVTLASPTHYIPWSVGIAAGLNNDKITAVLGAVIITLYGYPDDLLTNTIPAIAGLLLGSAVRAFLLEHQS